jgi:parallel beta-helix repeat protein
VTRSVASENIFDGISVTFGADNRIEGNRIAGNGESGVEVSRSNRTVIAKNHFGGNGRLAPGDVPCGDPQFRGGGITLFAAQGSRIERNILDNNTYALALFRSSRNRVAGNQAGTIGSDGNACNGISLYDSDDNRIEGNTAAENAPDNIFVNRYSSGNVLEGNVADSTGTTNEDGIDVRNARTTITGNTATNNVRYGIVAVPGVTDGGGNRAHGNGAQPQCVNVACTP